MAQNSNDQQTINLDSYLRLFEPYVEQMGQFTEREGEFGSRFALLFRQVLRLLIQPVEFNQRLPKLFLEVAQRYLAKNEETIRHFSYEDNRYFFLNDLYDWLQVHERGRLMRQAAKQAE